MISLFKSTKSFSKSYYFLLLLQLLFLYLPNLLYILLSYDFDNISFVKAAGYILLSWSVLLLPLLILSIKRFFYLGFAFLLLAPIDLLHLYIFKSPVSVGIIDAVFNTNFSEAIELGTNYTPFFILYFLSVAVYAYVTIRKTPTGLRLSKTAKVSLLSLLLVLNAGLFVQQYRLTTAVNQEKSTTEIFDLALSTFTLKYHKIFPYSLGFKYFTLEELNKEKENFLSYSKKFSFGAYPKKNTSEREIYVVVIGETSRYDHWSINGYERETSPLLSKQEGLISFSNVISCANMTSLSIPFILTRLTPDTYDQVHKQASFLKAFKEAGFYTTWITNQSRVGRVQQIQEADTLLATNSTFEYNYQYDENLLPLLQKVLNSEHKKLLVVLHTMGSHFRYNYRYPKSFERFTPAFKDNFDYALMSSENLPTIVNTYDNTILYTDYVLSSIIKELEKTGNQSTMLYVADHGENLGDSEEELFYHGSSLLTKAELHIPMFFWYSEEYKKQHRLTINALKENKNQAISTENIFHSLLDIAQIGYKEEDLSKSFANDSFKSKKVRKVMTLDYKAVPYKEDIKQQ